MFCKLLIKIIAMLDMRIAVLDNLFVQNVIPLADKTHYHLVLRGAILFKSACTDRSINLTQFDWVNH